MTCYNCEDREIGCHATCESYLSECKKRQEEAEGRKMHPRYRAYTAGFERIRSRAIKEQSRNRRHES